jgi:predicted metallopeptidase
MKFEYAPDVEELCRRITEHLDFGHVDVKRIKFMRSHGSKANAVARMWSLPKVWQLALNTQPHYVMEVLSHHYDKLDIMEKERTIIHELLHVPKTFSGNLVPHKCFGKNIDDHRINSLHKEYTAKRALANYSKSL